jgi:alkane 1-monooxygenase
LEIINYIEHYGLLRKEVKSGVYEKVQPWHSWNSDHVFGRVFLFELTRHSDHHYKASRKYQVLRHFEESPQLPSGYPAMMLLSLIPSMWFRVMNPRVQAIQTPSRKTSREDA